VCDRIAVTASVAIRSLITSGCIQSNLWSVDHYDYKNTIPTPLKVLSVHSQILCVLIVYLFILFLDCAQYTISKYFIAQKIMFINLNPTSAGAGITVPNITMFVSVFCTRGCGLLCGWPISSVSQTCDLHT
jgi:hypothetical protein